MSVADELRALEERLMRPDVRTSPADVAALLADEFVELGASGRRWDKASTVASLAAETTAPARVIHDFEARPVAAGLWLALYRVTRHATPPLTTWRSSLWRRDADGWRLVFHQGTPTAATAD